MISIIIPVYNGENFIGRAIDSVIAQRGKWELIIVNDHSTDNTQKILTEYAAGDKRIVIVDSQSKGVTDARMAGAYKASGEYLFFMDADDELPPDIIRETKRVVESDNTLDMVISDITEICGNDTAQRSYGEKSFTNGRELFNWIIDQRTGFLWGKAIRKSLFLSLTYVPSTLKFCEDYVQMLQLSIKAKRIKHVGKTGYIYYQNPTSACNTVKSRENYADQFYKLAAAIKDLAKMSDFSGDEHEAGLLPATRLKVMFLYYARLYLAVMGGWSNDKDKLKCHYKEWMNNPALLPDPLYDHRRRRQTKIAYYFPWLSAAFYVPVLKYKYHRIK